MSGMSQFDVCGAAMATAFGATGSTPSTRHPSTRSNRCPSARAKAPAGGLLRIAALDAMGRTPPQNSGKVNPTRDNPGGRCTGAFTTQVPAVARLPRLDRAAFAKVEMPGSRWQPTHSTHGSRIGDATR